MREPCVALRAGEPARLPSLEFVRPDALEAELARWNAPVAALVLEDERNELPRRDSTSMDAW